MYKTRSIIRVFFDLGWSTFRVSVQLFADEIGEYLHGSGFLSAIAVALGALTTGLCGSDHGKHKKRHEVLARVFFLMPRLVCISYSVVLYLDRRV